MKFRNCSAASHASTMSLRGGSPTSFDRLTALRFGAAAVRGLEDGQNGVMVALAPPHVKYVPIDVALGKIKMVPMDSDIRLYR